MCVRVCTALREKGAGAGVKNLARVPCTAQPPSRLEEGGCLWLPLGLVWQSGRVEVGTAIAAWRETFVHP